MKFGAMQSILRRRGPELIRTAAELGFEGVQLDLRADYADDPLLTVSGRQALKSVLSETGLAVSSVCLGVLNQWGFKMADPEVRTRTTDLILRAMELAAAVDAKALLIPFFGNSDLVGDALGQKRAAAGLAELAPQAERLGLALAIESFLNAADVSALCRAVGSPAAKVYYDVSNTTYMGYDPAAELVALAPLIAEIHFKDGKGDHSNAMLGQGDVNYPAVVASIRKIGYDGWIVLESAAPHDPIADARTNLEFAKRVLG